MDDGLTEQLRVLFDGAWYQERYPDVRASGMDPLQHYIRFGANEGRDPNRFFDGAWYREHYPDVTASQLDPLLHYLRLGARELRNPHPRFDAAWYAEQHLEAAVNPLLYHMLFGRQRGWAIARPVDVAAFLPSTNTVVAAPSGVVVDVVIPVYRGLAETRRCIESVIADPKRPPGRIIVVDDVSPEPALSAWLDMMRGAGRIMLVRNPRNQGFVASANIGIQAAGSHDVVLLNSDTEAPSGWLARLAGHAYAAPRIASVSPFSNNATICGYPSIAGGEPALGLPVSVIDEACQTANAGRRVEVPTTVGFCMYLRRDALNDVGLLDARAFGRGYGEENDFCLRAAARGWQHVLACDTFVFHQGNVSFGDDARSQFEQGQSVLAQRWPGYAALIDQHVRRDDAGPARFAATAALFRRFDRPVILLVSHGLGGGVRRHIGAIVERVGAQANFLLLECTASGVSISVPALPGHSVIVLPADRQDDVLAVLSSAGVSRVHVHHLMGMDIDLRHLIHALGVPFDVTVHDYYPICPQVNLLPWLDGQYCGEPGAAACNACIAERPSHGAADIVSWRRGHAWLFIEADRVFCPSEDVRTRLERHGLADRAVVAPHEPMDALPWPLRMPRLQKGQKLRIALIGVLAQQKGAATVAAVAETAEPNRYDIKLIGYPEQELPEPARRLVRSTGGYKDTQLPALLAKVNPHVVWFPAQWPETYSYTLSAAIDAGVPIVASAIGAFPERLHGRPHTWLVDPSAPTRAWIDAFEKARAALLARTPATPPMRESRPDLYATGYVRKPAPRGTGLVDLRRPGRTSVVVIPERFSTGPITPCAYIRLLQPLDHLAAAARLDIILADAAEALRYRADMIVTQRYAVQGAEDGDALLKHCREHDIRLLYDLDDDLIAVPRDHPDATQLRAHIRDVERLLRGADTVWVSTVPLRDRIAAVRPDAVIAPNGLDERLWPATPPEQPANTLPVRLLFMGTATHDADFALIEPALARLHETFGARISFDMIGVTGRDDLPSWVRRVPPSISGTLSYPGFINWIIRQPSWDIGLAPLADTPFNRAKSAIKALDYAALGLTVAASDVAVYREALGKSAAALLVPNTPAAWYDALARLVRQPLLRRQLANAARAAWTGAWTLAAQEESRLVLWQQALSARLPGRIGAKAGRRPGNGEGTLAASRVATTPPRVLPNTRRPAGRPQAGKSAP